VPPHLTTIRPSVRLAVPYDNKNKKNNNFTPDLQLKSELLPTQRTAAKESASRNVIKRRSVGVVFELVTLIFDPLTPK